MITILFAGCATLSNCNYPSSDYLGEWTDDTGAVVTSITEEKIETRVGRHLNWAITVEKWIAIKNFDAALKSEWPSGYKVIGTYIYSAEGNNEKVGDRFERKYFINIDQNQLMLSYNVDSIMTRKRYEWYDNIMDGTLYAIKPGRRWVWNG
jgi:hypothetical protein